MTLQCVLCEFYLSVSCGVNHLMALQCVCVCVCVCVRAYLVWISPFSYLLCTFIVNFTFDFWLFLIPLLLMVLSVNLLLSLFSRAGCEWSSHLWPYSHVRTKRRRSERQQHRHEYCTRYSLFSWHCVWLGFKNKQKNNLFFFFFAQKNLLICVYNETFSKLH